MDRKEVSLLLKPGQLHSIIKSFITLPKMLKLLPESDRLDLLLYLGVAYLKERLLAGDSDYISFSLDEICKLLPAFHRIRFLTSFDPAYLQLLNNDWLNIAHLINNLTSEEDAVFFEHIGPDLIKPLIRRDINSVIYLLCQEKRLGFLCLINRLFPELLDEIFMNGKKANPNNFVHITKLLSKEEKDRFSFFALFSVTNLRKLLAQIYDPKVSNLLRRYLETKNSNQFPANAVIPDRKSVV